MGYFNRRKPSQRPPVLQHGYTLPQLNHYRNRQYPQTATQQIKDYGPYPFVFNIEQITGNNTNYRTALWTGQYMQMTLMSLLPGEDIGLEMHNDVEQFIRIEEGKGLVMMGNSETTPNFQQTVFDSDAFFIPAGTWHNLINIGTTPLKLYSIYAPPQHPFGTIHETKEEAQQAEESQ